MLDGRFHYVGTWMTESLMYRGVADEFDSLQRVKEFELVGWKD